MTENSYTCRLCNHVYVVVDKEPISKHTCLKCLMRLTSPKYISLHGIIYRWYKIEKEIYDLNKLGFSNSTSNRLVKLKYQASIIKKRVIDMEREDLSKILLIEKKVKEFQEQGIVYKDEDLISE